MKRTRRWIALALTGAVALGACGSDSAATTDTIAGPTVVTITVSAGDTSESRLLAEIYAQALENAGLRVARKDAIGPREQYYPALVSGAVSLVPELSNSLLVFLRPDGAPSSDSTPTSDSVPTSDSTPTSDSVPTSDSTPTSDPSAAGDLAAAAAAADLAVQIAALTTALPPELVIGAESAAQDREVIVCSAAIAEQFALHTLTDLAKVADKVTIGGPAEFETGSPVGLVGLKDTYGAEFKAFIAVDTASVASSISAGDIDCGVLRTTMSVILADGLIPLDDDKALIPNDVVLPLLNATAATPEVLAAVDAVTTALTTDVLRSLMVKVDVDAQPVDVVAKTYIASLASASGN